MYEKLDSDRIIVTVETLARRIRERFPDAGLAKLADALIGVMRESVSLAKTVHRPKLLLRLVIAALLLAGPIATYVLFTWASHSGAAITGLGVRTVADLVQTLESAFAGLVFLGAAILFVLSLENRLKRIRVLRFLHRLRSIAHIVDMHQLTKDPELLLRPGPTTKSSPVRKMSRFEMGRYFDYCSEMLAMISKAASLYVQDYEDPIVMSAVDQIETLTTGLSRKIWQKAMILGQVGKREGVMPPVDD